MFQHARFHPEGYEVSSAGDRRFSALYARLPDGRTIEEAYQLDVKGYRATSNDWRVGKGKPPIRPRDLWPEYKDLWRQWACLNPEAMKDLKAKADSRVLTDRFASSPISQARALAEILNEMTQHATIDFETYSEAGYEWNGTKWVPPEGGSATNRGLSLVGVVNYTRHPTFEVLCAWYRLPGQQLTLWTPDMPPPADLFAYIQAGGIVEAHNHAFEHRVFQALGWPEVPLAQQRCSMAKSRAWALPGALKEGAEVLGTFDKNAGGKKGIQMFCVPKNPTKTNAARRTTRRDKPQQFQELIIDYCADDVRAEEALSERVPELSPLELEHWWVDQTVNRRGISIDVPTVQAMREIQKQVWEMYAPKCRALTGGIEPTQVTALIKWAKDYGVTLEALDAEAIEEAFERDDLPEPVRQMLEYRSAVASASVKKINAMLNSHHEGRAYDQYKFHAARTGRPTAEKIQIANLPRGALTVQKCVCGRWQKPCFTACLWCGSYVGPLQQPDEWNVKAMHDCLEIMATGNAVLVEKGYGNALKALAGCLRGVLIAKDGCDFVSSDYTAIEAVVLACLAGEQWRIDLFKNKGKIYEASGAKVGGVTYESLLEYKAQTGKHHALRQVGKTAELGLGFMGWINAWLNFDKSGTRSDEEIKQLILRWRAENPAIVEFWGGQKRRNPWKDELFGVEGAFIHAVLNPGKPVNFRGLLFEASAPQTVQRWKVAAVTPPCMVQITLLSGRKITYHSVVLEPSDRPWSGNYSISYEGYNTNTKKAKKGWARMRTHGGMLTENIVQATANDILRFAMANCERAAYPIVMHTYDEIVCEVPKGWGSVEELETIMKTLPAWAAGWPIGADGGWRGKRYRKG
jgi:DNA polymerase bacteriophage-type